MINKPINPSPFNCCVDVSNDICIKYEIPNNEPVDGRYISINNLSDGSLILDSYEVLSEPTSIIKWDVSHPLFDGGEYSWSSFYWQTSDVEADNSYLVSNIDVDTSTIFLKPKGDSICSITPSYKNPNNLTNRWQVSTSHIADSPNKYSSLWFGNSGHEFGDDTSSYCCEGVLEDYFGYGGFCTYGGSDSLMSHILDIGLGKCVLEIYDNDGVLAGRARCLAYDYDRSSDPFQYFVIIDNSNFLEQIKGRIGTYGLANGTTYLSQACIPYKTAYLYSVDDLNAQENVEGMIKCEDSYSFIKNIEFVKHHYQLSLFPNLLDVIQIGDTIEVWSRESANFNVTPTYYFRTKSSPMISIDVENLENVNGVNVLRDVKCTANLNYASSRCRLNYFYWYLYALNPKTKKWELKERSPMITNVADSYNFIGFVDEQEYKICVVCTDNDGDEWESEEFQFIVDNPSITSCEFSVLFNKNRSTVDISLSKIIDIYRNFSVEFYKVLKNDLNPLVNLEYAGGGLCKTGGEYGMGDDTTNIYNGSVISYDMWIDYNIKNDAIYDYYARVSYTGRNYDLSGNIPSKEIYIQNGDIIYPSDTIVAFYDEYSIEGYNYNINELDTISGYNYTDFQQTIDPPLLEFPPNGIHEAFVYNSCTSRDGVTNQLPIIVVRPDSSYNTIGDENSQGVDFFMVASNLHTDFKGTSILGLEKSDSTVLNVTNQFNLFYRFDKELHELTNEISREYINSFSRYPKELKGHQNYITGQCSGLLGYEADGKFVEAKGISDAWSDFVNDDTIKFYRGIDGKTMIISIDTSRIKPFYYPSVGLVNEVNMSFKQIASTDGCAIFGIEKTG